MFLSLDPCTIPMIYWKQSTETDYSLPLVTCIMPTANRPDFMLKSIQYFLEQDYSHKELVIIDDGRKPAFNKIPGLFSIRYFYQQPKKTIGTKRNLACEKAAGSIIVHWDDDDRYAPDWISHQVYTLLRSGADICGLNRVNYYLEPDRLYFTIDHKKGKKDWLSGATLAYHRSFWKKNHFKDLQIAEDDEFLQCKDARIFTHHYSEGFLAIIHKKNTRIKEIL